MNSRLAENVTYFAIAPARSDEFHELSMRFHIRFS